MNPIERIFQAEFGALTVQLCLRQARVEALEEELKVVKAELEALKPKKKEEK